MRPVSIEITNCHTHTFTNRHTPLYYPIFPFALFRVMPYTVGALRWLSSWLGNGARFYNFMVRMEKFHNTGRRGTQRDVFQEMIRHYPRSTKFVVLPLDLTPIGHGPVAEDIGAQMAELHALAQDPILGDRVIPFANIHPDNPDGVRHFLTAVNDYGFKGLKLYPGTGFAPDHPVLMREVYPVCEERGLPIMTHCSRGGVRRKGWTRAQSEAASRPRAFEPVMKSFPNLRICLAHFGGDADWHAYLDEGTDPYTPHNNRENWLKDILEMIRSGDYPNLYTDISYTIFKFEKFVPLLKLFLGDPSDPKPLKRVQMVREKVLFGSDFYMTRQEGHSEKEISIRLRGALGEDLFRQIAETNPKSYLQGTPPKRKKRGRKAFDYGIR